MNEHDVFMHAEVHGGAVVIVKNFMKRKVPMETLKEAAIFAASYSKAWKNGLHVVDVFYTDPKHVSLTPPSGQYLPAGSFIIKKKEFLKNVPLRLSIGVILNSSGNIVTFQVLSAPSSVMKKLTDYYVTISPGTRKKSEIAKTIIKRIKEIDSGNPYLLKVINNIKIEKIIDLIPGPSAIIEDEEDE